MSVCVFTGPRPQKIFISKDKYYGISVHIDQFSDEFDKILYNFFSQEISKLEKQLNIGTMFIGMALGCDMSVAKVCLDNNIDYIASIPHEKQTSYWSSKQVDRYNKLCAGAYKVCVIYPPDSKQCIGAMLNDRNIWMLNGGKLSSSDVKCSDKTLELNPLFKVDYLISLRDPRVTSGGTQNCAREANKRNIQEINLWTKWTKYVNYLGYQVL